MSRMRVTRPQDGSREVGASSRSGVRRAVAAVGAIAASVLLLFTASASPATASASGFTSWGQFTIPRTDMTIPSGGMHHWIMGWGNYVDQDYAEFWTAAPLCNWRIDFRYSDVWGTVYEVNRGPVNYRCNGFGERFQYVGGYKRYGKACADLYSNGALVARQCHNITA